MTVGDTTPPSLPALILSPATLAPPNHKLRAISVPTLTATDVCDPAPRILCAVSSSEPPNELGDGDTPIDIVMDGVPIATQSSTEGPIATTAGAGTFGLQVRAERAGGRGGRTYTAPCAPVDASGNRGGSRSATVTVR